MLTARGVGGLSRFSGLSGFSSPSGPSGFSHMAPPVAAVGLRRRRAARAATFDGEGGTVILSGSLLSAHGVRSRRAGPISTRNRTDLGGVSERDGVRGAQSQEGVVPQQQVRGDGGQVLDDDQPRIAGEVLGAAAHLNDQ